jgi:hypothetical protein
MESTSDLIYKVELLEDLIETQTKLLDTSNLIIQAKNRMIDLCEEEAVIYRRENATFKLLFATSCIVIVALSSVLILSAL